jgi:hypothetical protein
MKIFGIGLSRTGTTSLCAGLERLGLKTIHFPFPFFGRPEALGSAPFTPMLKRGPWRRWKLHRELKALRCHDIETILADYEAFADLPVPLYFRELDQLYNDARFIYTTRPLEDWLESMQWLFEGGAESRGWAVGELILELRYQIYGTYRFEPDRLKEAFRRHEAAVMAHFASKPDKLLRVDLAKDDLNFQTIASFLELPVPDEPFPLSNQKNEPKENG